MLTNYSGSTIGQWLGNLYKSLPAVEYRCHDAYISCSFALLSVNIAGN